MALRFIALSGTTDVTENLYVYETDRDIMVVDCGVGFPDLEMPGVELVLPDFSYIVKNKHKLRGIVLSQGHDDHIGALPFLLRDLSREVGFSAPIWATPLVTEFLKVKFKDYDVRNFRINTFDPDRDDFRVGQFKIFPFRVTHSVPDTVGFAIDTPEGRIFHVAEHKMDQTGEDGMVFDIPKAKRLAEKNVLCLMSDCLGANEPGFTPSGVEIEANMLKIVAPAQRTVYMTAISSNIGRFQQMINVAQKTQRRVVTVGRSIQKKVEIALSLGYLTSLPGTIIEIREALRLTPRELLYIVSGCYGQVGSSLYRLALGEHEKVSVNSGDTFVFSADPGPAYSKEGQDFIVDALVDRGLDVHYYDTRENLHVSGHGSKEDIKELFKIVRPKYFIPTGGTLRYMHSYQKLVSEAGQAKEKVFKLKLGESVVFENGWAKQGETVAVKDVFVHGLGVGDIGSVVLGHRNVLGSEGVVVVVVKIGKDGKIIARPEMISRGFIFEQKYGKVLVVASEALARFLNKEGFLKTEALKDLTVDFLEKFFYEETGRRPMVLPVFVTT